MVSGGGGGRKFLALDAPGTVLVATGRDPAIYEYAGAMRQATNEWASGVLVVGWAWLFLRGVLSGTCL